MCRTVGLFGSSRRTADDVFHGLGARNLNCLGQDVVTEHTERLELKKLVRRFRVEADARLALDRGVAAASNELHELVPVAERGGRNPQQHRVVEGVRSGNSEALHVAARLGLLAFVGDARTPLVVRAGGALLGLRVDRVSGRGDTIVGVAVGFLDAARRVLLGVEDLGRALVGAKDHHLDAARRLQLAVDVRAADNFLGVAALDGPVLTLDRDDGEAARHAGQHVLDVEQVFRDGDGQLGGGGAVERDEVAHGVYSV